jgi:hypothetical protein
MGEPIIDGKIAAIVTTFTDHEKLTTLPADVTVSANVTEGGTGAVTITESLPAENLSRKLSFTIRSDAKDGFAIINTTVTSSITIGDADMAPFNGIIKNKLLAPKEITWMKEAILKKAFTWNTDLQDEKSTTSALNPNTTYNPLERLHILQDHLQAVINKETYSESDHLLIAGMINAMPADFFTIDAGYTYNTGIPWSELYFTKFLLEQAKEAYKASPQNSPYVSELYDASLTTLNSVLDSRTYEEFCSSRGIAGDLLTSGMTHSFADEEKCDQYDAEVSLTDPSYWPNSTIIMPPPFKAGSATTLFAKAAGPITGTVMETAAQEAPGVLERNRTDVKRTAVIALDITTDLMDDPEFTTGLSKLVTAVTLSDGNADTVEVSEIFQGLLLKTLQTGLDQTPEFLAANAPKIEALSTSFTSLLIRIGHSRPVQSEVESLSRDYLAMAARLASDPKIQTSLHSIAVTGFEISADVLDDPVVQRSVDEMSGTLFALSETIMTQHHDDLVRILDFGTRLGIEGAAGALSNPDEAATRESLVKSIVAMIALGQQEMTGIIMADPNLAPYIEQLDQLMVLSKAYLEKKTKHGRVAPMPAQGPYHHQQEALLAGMDHWEEMKKLTIRGYSVEAEQLDKANGANLHDGHLRGEMAIPEGLTSEDVMKAMTSQSQHANTLTKDLKANILLSQDGQELDLTKAPKDKFGNPCSFIDAQGNSHYLVFQYLTVDPIKLAYVIDLALIETQDAYILSWNRATDKYKAFVDAQAAKGMKGGESSTNFGNWYVKKDGSAMGYSVCASGTGMLISAAPQRLAANVVDMADFALKQKAAQ